MTQRSPRARTWATRSEISTVLPEPVVPETMVCWVSVRGGYGIPATRQDRKRPAPGMASRRRACAGCTWRTSSRAVTSSAPLMRRRCPSRAPRNQNQARNSAMIPAPTAAPRHAAANISSVIRSRIRQAGIEAAIERMVSTCLVPSGWRISWLEFGS